jgi:imidazolonepropionase-like amidohydrolase
MIGWKSVLGACFGMMALTTPLYSQTPQVVAVRPGRLFDSKSGQLLTRQVVLIQGDRISEVGSEDQVKIPPGAQVIDLSQSTVLPGLIDGHSHVYDSLTAGGRVNRRSRPGHSSL